MRRPRYETIAASAACVLAAAALAVALGRDGGDGGTVAPLPAGATTGDAAPVAPQHVPSADRAKRADSARVADRADRARTATRARRATVAGRVDGAQARRIDRAARAADALETPPMVRMEIGQTRTLIDRGPFRLEASCSRPKPKFAEVRVTARSEDDGALLEIAGTLARPIGPEQEPVVLELRSNRGVWLGGRAFSYMSPKGDAIHGVLAVGINRLGRPCVASAAGLS